MLRLHLSPPLAPCLARLYACDRDFVRHVLQGTGVPAVDIDDLVQDVFLVAWRRIADLDPLGPSRPWLFTIAQLVAANHKKRARHRHEVPQWGEDEARSSFPDPEENALVAARDAALRRSIHRLRPSLRAVLVLHDLDGLGLPDIAARLGISTKACGTRLTKARGALARRHDVRSLAARPASSSRRLRSSIARPRERAEVRTMANPQKEGARPKGQLDVPEAARRDIETIERERLAQEHVQQTGHEGDLPATGVTGGDWTERQK